MSEQEIQQLAFLLEKAKGTLTPSGKAGPDYIIVINDQLVGISVEVITGNVREFTWDITSDNNDVVVDYTNLIG